MSNFERLEELRVLLQADYDTAKKEYEEAVLNGNDVAKDYFYGVMQTLDHVFNYVRILQK